MNRSQIILGIVLLVVVLIVAAVKLGDSNAKPARPASGGGLQIRVP